MKQWIIPSLAALCLAGSAFFVASRSGTTPSAASPAGPFSGGSPASSGSTPAASVSTRVASSAATSPQGVPTDIEARLSATAATRIAADPAARHSVPSGGGPSASAGETASSAVADAPPAVELAPLPVVFQLDPQSYINLGPGEDAIIADAQREFSDAMADAGAPDSAAYLKRWNRAQWDADNRLRLELGATGFNRLASQAMEAAGAGK